MAVPTITRNFMLDALFGHPELTYSFDPATAVEMQIRLYDGDPLDGGTEVAAIDYPVYTVDTSEDEYPDAFDGVNKIYIGTNVTYQAENNWGTVTHIALGPLFMPLMYGVELDTPVVMNAGIYLRLTLPSLTWSAGTAMAGVSDELRTTLLNSMFANPFVGDKNLCPSTWEYALWIGDPVGAGVEVSAPDYSRVILDNGVGWPSPMDPYTNAFTSTLLVFPPAQADWGEVTHLVMINGDTDVALHAIELDTPIDVTAGTLVRWLPGDLVMTFGGPV